MMMCVSYKNTHFEKIKNYFTLYVYCTFYINFRRNVFQPY